jgi:hypothetical protein
LPEAVITVLVEWEDVQREGFLIYFQVLSRNLTGKVAGKECKISSYKI